MNRLCSGKRTTLQHDPTMRAAAVYDLYEQRYDFTTTPSDTTSEFMLATLPRAGSTHLAVELWRTGVMGAPMEYANHPLQHGMRQRLGGGDDLIAYWNAVKRVRTSPNGTFGFKMFASDYTDLYAQHRAFLAHLMPHRIIFLTRANIVEQAVSYSKAIRSGQWFPQAQERIHVAYDAAHISWCVATLRQQIDFWNEMFVRMDASPHRVVYEALVADPTTIIRGIADFLGVALDPDAIVDLPHMQIQRDDDSAEWVRHYQSEHGVRSVIDASCGKRQ